MWVIGTDGFVSLVAHRDSADMVRARARRRDHLVDTFGLSDDEVEDLGENCSDYRWHADISRDRAAEALAKMVYRIDYTSHVKEEVSKGDNLMYRAMMKCWRALRPLQDPIIDVNDEGEWREPTLDFEWPEYEDR